MTHYESLIHNLCSKGFHIQDNFLEHNNCQSLSDTAKELYHQGLYRGAKIGKTISSQKNNTIRTDEILWLEGNEAQSDIQLFLAQIHQLAQTLNQALFLGLNEFESHFASYQPGTYYKKHKDQFATQNTRKISFVYYLNKNWQESYGGELKLYSPEDQLIQIVLPQENRFICFNSELPHEVATTHKPRYSLTGWLKTRT